MINNDTQDSIGQCVKIVTLLGPMALTGVLWSGTVRAIEEQERKKSRNKKVVLSAVHSEQGSWENGELRTKTHTHTYVLNQGYRSPFII